MKRSFALILLFMFIISSTAYAQMKVRKSGDARLRVGTDTATQSPGVELGVDSGTWSREAYISAVSSGAVTYRSLSQTFKSNGFGSPITALVITQNGFVGIGTTAPSAALDVSGAARANSLQSPEGRVDVIKDLDGSGFFENLPCSYAVGNIAQDGNVTCVIPSGLGNVSGPSGATLNNIALFDGTTGKLIKEKRIAVNSDGNLVIDSLWRDKIILSGLDYFESNAPHTILTYAGKGFRILENSAINILEVVPEGAGFPDLKMRLTGDLNLNDGFVGDAAALRVNGVEAMKYYNTGDYFQWGAGANKNYFKDNVGVGTSVNPAYKLDVNGQLKGDTLCAGANCISGSLALLDNVADTHLNMNDYQLQNVRAIQLKDWDDDSGGADSATYMTVAQDGAWQFEGGGVVVGQYGNNTWTDARTGKMIVQDRVGIRQTNPTEKLDVNGDAYVGSINHVHGDFLMDNAKAVRVVHIEGAGIACPQIRDWDTPSFPDTEWFCETGSFMFYNGDIQENGTVDPAWFITCTKNGSWYVGYDFASHNDNEEFKGRVICYRRDMVEFNGGTWGGGVEWYGTQCSGIAGC